jgi:predicted lipid-binding transport protein (Tim44 family)
MSDLDPDRVTEDVRVTPPSGGPATQVTRSTERSIPAAWWAIALVGIALIAAVTFIITRPQASNNTDQAVAAATQQLQTDAASQQAQSAAASAQAAAQSAAIQGAASQAAAARSGPPPAQPASQPNPPASSDQSDQSPSSSPPPQ